MARVAQNQFILCVVVATGVLGFGGEMPAQERVPPDPPSGTDVHEITPCGPASLAVAFRLLDVPVDNYELDQLSDANGASNFYEMCEYARSKGLHADVAALSPKALVELDRVAVLHLRPPNAPAGDDAFHHFVVFVGVDSTGRWHMVDPVGVSPFSGMIDAEALVRSWTGRALILSLDPLAWPLERGWWVRRWSIAALWWVVAPLASLGVIYALLGWRSKRKSSVAATAILVLTTGFMSCLEVPNAQANARLTSVAEPLRNRIIANLNEAEGVLRRFDRLSLSTADHAGILMHGLLGHGRDFALQNGDESVSCFEWLLHRASSQHPVFQVTDVGPIFRSTSTDVNACEAHFGQALFSLSETDIDPDLATIKIDAQAGAQPLSVLVKTLRINVHEYADLSFCLPVILRWSKGDRWQCRFGSEWTLSRLLDAHLDAEERSVVCGGGHWRYALAFAVKGDHGRSLDRLILERSAHRLDEILNTTLASIEADGRIPDGAVPVPDTMRFSHQVHSLEWLMIAVSDETMRSHAQLHEAVCWALRAMTERWDVLSPRDLCHAAHALRLYRDRIIGIAS